MHHSEIPEVILVHCNIVYNDYQQDNKKDIYQQKKQKIIDVLRLIEEYNNGIWKNNKVVRQCTKWTISL